MNDRPVYRAEDGELVGYLRRDGDGWLPLTVFGYPLAEAGPHEESVAELEGRGLAVLGDRWSVRHDGEWLACRLTEAEPGRVAVRITDFGSPDCGRTRVLDRPGPEVLRLD
ncbi:hypothetical protein [Amycolatopsis sp. CA-230715]|uniref:hypothetical protein n=1 Tax=Amycolatopsis sp. CA-230715 TaxID=2745196 RepID=UPI001C020BDD|nr:hypothetical protein [Amycolatopsis sp. CA-230715]QWF80547.1 hypothetical protein HUW46_03970 [Amycolatopsis sp. CA-230715]